MITLTPRGDGTYAEPGQDVAWVLTSYTEPREHLDDCTECGEPIGDWTLFLCMDGGEAAHVNCTAITPVPVSRDIPLAEISTAWPAGKTFGELTPAQRRAASSRAAAQLQDELARNADAISRVLDDHERN